MPSALFFGVGGCWLWFASPSYLCIPVQIDDYWGEPLVQMEIGKKSYQVKLDFGVGSSCLNRQELREIDKQCCGSYVATNTLGESHERAMYEVSGIKIHGLKVPKIKIHEATPVVILSGDPDAISYCGRVSWKILAEKNFLLDFASSKIIVCRDFKDLAKNQYDLNNFVEVPFEVNKAGICFRAETDLGEQTLLLNPSLFRSMLRSPSEKEGLSIESLNSLQLWHNQKLNLGGSEFGPKDFVFFEISPLIDMIDGTLGMDFFKEHAVYIDMKRSVAYIEKHSVKA